MNRLTLVELRRLGWRRLVWAVLLMAVGVVALTLYGVNDMVRMSSAELANADRYYQEAVQDWEVNGERYHEECLQDQEREREATGDDTLDFGCDQMVAPELADFQWGPESLFVQVNELLAQLVFPMLFLVLLVGATATAAEFGARTIGTWLTFEPRRDRVFTSKVLAPGLWAVPVSVGYLVLVVAGVSAVFRLHGVDDHISNDEWADLAWVGLRSVALLALVAAAGAAVGLAVRHTAAVLGIVVGYLVTVEILLAQFFPGIARYSLSNNILAWVKGGHEWETWRCPSDGGECEAISHVVSTTQAGTLLGLVVAATLLVCWLVFRRADVN